MGQKAQINLGMIFFIFSWINKNNKLHPDAGDYLFATTDDQKLACCNFKSANTCKVPQDTGVSCAQYALTDTWPHDDGKRYWDMLP